VAQSNATGNNPLYQKGQTKEILGDSNGLLRNNLPEDPQAAEEGSETEGDQAPKQ
jgi:hypothetical protein